MVKTTLIFNQPVILLDNDIWIPNGTLTEWTKVFIDNVDREIKFQNIFDKDNTG